jgi:hypothetical protein
MGRECPGGIIRDPKQPSPCLSRYRMSKKCCSPTPAKAEAAAMPDAANAIAPESTGKFLLGRLLPQCIQVSVNCCDETGTSMDTL